MVLNMMIDHQKNLLILENLDYLKKFYDVDENKKSYSVTETGIKTLIAWNKIHGFEDKLGVNMAYPEPISDDEMRSMFSEFLNNKFITKIWNAKLQTEDYPPSIDGFELFESLKYFIDDKLQKNLARKETAKQILSGMMKGLVTVTKKMAESSVPLESDKKRKRKRKGKKKQRGKQK
jgi:hypothetical protein